MRFSKQPLLLFTLELRLSKTNNLDASATDNYLPIIENPIRDNKLSLYEFFDG
jgi:hypothetical protein